MKALERVLISLVAGISVYSLFFFMAGQDGFWAKSQLQEQSMTISLQKCELEKTRDALKLQKDALQYDSDVVASYAKKLGLVATDETLLKINGLMPRSVPVADIGFVKFMQPILYIPENICKAAGVCVFFAVFIMLVLLDIKNKTATKYSTNMYDIKAQKESNTIQAPPISFQQPAQFLSSFEPVAFQKEEVYEYNTKITSQ